MQIPDRHEIDLRMIRWFSLMLLVFAGLLGALVLYKGLAFWFVSQFLLVAWVISLIFNSENRRAQLLGVLLPILCGSIGGSICAGVEPLKVAMIVWIVGGGAAAGVWIFPSVGCLVYRGWMLAGVPISWTVTRLVLGLTYYLILTPIGRIQRVFGRDQMGRRLDPSASSYWQEHDPSTDPARYFRQF